jgi:hypothetical protein
VSNVGVCSYFFHSLSVLASAVFSERAEGLVYVHDVLLHIFERVLDASELNFEACDAVLQIFDGGVFTVVSLGGRRLDRERLQLRGDDLELRGDRTEADL